MKKLPNKFWKMMMELYTESISLKGGSIDKARKLQDEFEEYVLSLINKKKV